MLIRVAIVAAAEDTAGRLLRESRSWKIFINFISQALEICRKDLFESVMKHLYLHVFAFVQSPLLKHLGERVTGATKHTQHECCALSWTAKLVVSLEHSLHGTE